MTSGAGPILVVDDDDDLRSLVAEVLEDDGYVVATAPNGAEALAALRAGARPRLVLLDLVMPGLDGNEVLDAIEADASLRGTPVLLLTGDATAATRGRVVGLVPKPVDLDGLLGAVARATGRA